MIVWSRVCHDAEPLRSAHSKHDAAERGRTVGDYSHVDCQAVPRNTASHSRGLNDRDSLKIGARNAGHQKFFPSDANRAKDRVGVFDGNFPMGISRGQPFLGSTFESFIISHRDSRIVPGKIALIFRHSRTI